MFKRLLKALHTLQASRIDCNCYSISIILAEVFALGRTWPVTSAHPSHYHAYADTRTKMWATIYSWTIASSSWTLPSWWTVGWTVIRKMYHSIYACDTSSDIHGLGFLLFQELLWCWIWLQGLPSSWHSLQHRHKSILPILQANSLLSKLSMQAKSAYKLQLLS